MNAKWSDADTLCKQVERLWQRGLLLQEIMQPSDLFPYRLTLKAPGSDALTHEFEQVRQWAIGLGRLQHYRVEYKRLRHRVIGEQQWPVAVWLDDLDSALALLGKQQAAQRFSRILKQTGERAGQLLPWLQKKPLKALALADNWMKLLDFIAWRQQHAAPKCYLRQVSVPGIDSKFIEQHKSVLSEWLDLSLPKDQIDTSAKGIRGFERRYGFRQKASRIRFRILDPAVRLLPCADQDLSLTAEAFAALGQSTEFIRSVQRVFITENEINYLAFPCQSNSVVIFGAGYGFDGLAQAEWLQSRELVYWGDIDTNGFAILSQLRAKFSHVISLLMDTETLLAHKAFWGHEVSPKHEVLAHLTEQEDALYQKLVTNHYQPQLRLEQERVHYDVLLKALARPFVKT